MYRNRHSRMFNGRRAEWNGGWEGCEPCPYTVLSEHDFALQLERTAFSCKRGTADCATFQPFPAPNVSQDRYVVHQFAAGGAQWKLWGVFDGTSPSPPSLFSRSPPTHPQGMRATRPWTSPRGRCRLSS